MVRPAESVTSREAPVTKAVTTIAISKLRGGKSNIIDSYNNRFQHVIGVDHSNIEDAKCIQPIKLSNVYLLLGSVPGTWILHAASFCHQLLFPEKVSGFTRTHSSQTFITCLLVFAGSV
ncbi:hypothetical protein J6590_092383 [Homalodisca vitripennis]|nr:hypothetical protein J6590_066884 [Homalodisca vitripennis]KAG8270106.1 hypothetical protein J6590_092383 [Homalodisca vitripennis]